MSGGQLSRHRSTSESSKSSKRSAHSTTPHTYRAAPEHRIDAFEPCAASPSFFLYAQRTIILCLHHDTLAAERRFEGHKEDVQLIEVDNVSERGFGRLVVSYDTGQTAIVWDLFTGDQIARFSAYENINVAIWMRNGNVAFGNSQGNLILFEPSTSEHISARTIYDPVTALAPAADLRTYAIGYKNGSILIACLQPTFTILHTLMTPRSPSTITALAWHTSSSKSKSEMLAAQTADGDLRVWSIPKVQNGDPPKIIRILNRADCRTSSPHWFAWSKNGRIVQYSDGETRAWDVRTKNVNYELVPTIEGITAIANYGPTATLFTLGRNHTVQQYDLAAPPSPMLVANVQHVPANAPPSPPNSIEEEKEKQRAAAAANEISVSGFVTQNEPESSEDEGGVMSPLQRIARERDQLDDERRDLVGPLSPVSSKASVSSRSSGGSHRQTRHDRSAASLASVKTGYSGTIFSSGSSVQAGRESMSSRSVSSVASSQLKSSSLKHQVFRSPDTPNQSGSTDLFPMVKARLSEVQFRAPKYDPSHNTADALRREMLSTVFGWDHDIEPLIRDELSHHLPGSASAVLLSKWLGDLSTDVMASMPGTESMTSSDWMLLALSSMGHDSQKKVGEAFVQRLLEKGDIHPAVAILLGLGEQNEAVEVYVSQKYFMEAVLLTCLIFPNEWQRQSYLVRKWGEVAVKHGSPELAVRCFSCTSIQSSEPWFSPRAQGEVFAAQQQQHQPSGLQTLSPSTAPLSAGAMGRMTTKNSALKLITSFDDKGTPQPFPQRGGNQMAGFGVTPIAESALSPGGDWLRPSARSLRDPSSARTATPGAYGRHRLPSTGRTPRTAFGQKTPRGDNAYGLLPSSAHPATMNHDQMPIVFPHVRSASQGQVVPNMMVSSTAYEPSNVRQESQRQPKSGALPSPAQGIFDLLRETSRKRNGSRDRKPDDLHLSVYETVIVREATPNTSSSSGWDTGPQLSTGMDVNSASYPDSPHTGRSVKSSKGRSIDKYISSLEEANYNSRQQRAESRSRGETRTAVSHAATEEQASSRGRPGVRYIRAAKQSPSSPVPMSPNRSIKGSTRPSFDDERYYGISSPVESTQSRGSDTGRPERLKPGAGSRAHTSRPRTPTRAISNARSGSKARAKVPNHATSRQRSPSGITERDARGRSAQRQERSRARSPSSPVPMVADMGSHHDELGHTKEASHQVEPLRPRQRSTSRRPDERGNSRIRPASPAQAFSRARADSTRSAREETMSKESQRTEVYQGRQTDAHVVTEQHGRVRALSRKELAARELEERRLSLARRPSVPVIPQPGELTVGRPQLSPRSATDLGNSPVSYLPPVSSLSARGITRSQTTEPESMMRYTHKTTGTSTSSTPIGLPATPRAMRHPRYMNADPNEREAFPAVPELPDNLEQPTWVAQNASEKEADQLAPLLPSTVFVQRNIPARSASAPPQQSPESQQHVGALPAHAAFRHDLPVSTTRRGSLNRGHARPTSPNEVRASVPNQVQTSPSIITASIDAALNSDSHVIIVGNHDPAPPLLPELQHLATPPPPPPPPSMFRPGQSPTPSTSGSSVGVINIVMDENTRSGTPASRGQTPVIDFNIGVTPTGSPNMHRRGRGSMSEGTSSSSISGRLRSVRERMRSTSRSRNKSPPLESFTPSPYETVLPPFPFPRRDSLSKPQEGLNIHNQRRTSSEQVPPPPPPPPSAPPDQAEQMARSNKIFGPGYRHPKEIRANMPPDQLQMGVTQPSGGGGMM